MGRGFKALIDLCAEEHIGKITGVEDYHWTCMEFTQHWKTRIGVAIAKGVGGAVVREGKRQETEYKR